MSAETHEVRPLEDRRVFWDLLYLAAFCQHVTHSDRSRQLIPDAGDDDVLDPGVLTDRFDLVIELVESHYHDRVRHVEIVLYLLFRAERMHHICDCSDQVDRIEHIDRLRAIRHRDRDPVILAYSKYPQRLGAQIDLIDHIFICDMFAHEIHGDHQRVLLRSLLDLFIHGAVEVFSGQRQIASAFVPWDLNVLRYRENYVPFVIECPFISHLFIPLLIYYFVLQLLKYPKPHPIDCIIILLSIPANWAKTVSLSG